MEYGRTGQISSQLFVTITHPLVFIQSPHVPDKYQRSYWIRELYAVYLCKQILPSLEGRISTYPLPTPGGLFVMVEAVYPEAKER